MAVSFRGRETAAEAIASANDESSAALLEVVDLVKHYGPVHAVRGVNLQCRRGEVHALVGENGAGKSTIAKMLAGVVRPSTGRILVEGEPLISGSVKDARRVGVRCAFQEIALVPDWTVGENLILPESARRGGFSQRHCSTATHQLLTELDVKHIGPNSAVRDLSLADRQIVEIARALAGKPKLLILDEASSALTPPGVRWLFERIHELTAEGTTVIYVSHRLDEIEEIADRCTVLRDGKVAGVFEHNNWTRDEVVSLMAGREVSRQFPGPPPLRVDDPQIAALEVAGLTTQKLKNVALRLAPGEILGVGGLQGHGQGELLRALYGAASATASSWKIGGRGVRRLNPVRAVHRGMGYVPEDRKSEGLALELTVGENLLAPWFRFFELGGRPRLRQEGSWIAAVLESLSVRTRGPLEDAGALSGGNQQKLVFGRWIDRNRKVILLHDPTRGVDVSAKQELYQAIIHLSEQGVGVIWFSTEVEELVNVCHRAIVLYEGAVADELCGERLTASAIVGAAVGTNATA